MALVPRRSARATKSSVFDELVVEPGDVLGEMPPFVLHAVGAGQHHVATVHASSAAEAVGWAESLQRAGRVEEYRLGPATLEDVYVALVGRPDALANGNDVATNAAPTPAPRTTPVASDVRAA